MAPSPTGFLHIGGVRTFLFNWLFARGRGGECLLRIENTDISREVAEAVEQIQRSLRWIGIDWDRAVTFQLDRLERCAVEARRLVEQGAAYEDEGAIRFRMPDEGVTGWDDAIRGRIEFPNAELEDLVLVRSDGRPTYNFASPVEDWLDGITHVIRGDDHISNTPEADPDPRARSAPSSPSTRTRRTSTGPTARSSRSGTAPSRSTSSATRATSPRRWSNFLALLGWAPDGETTLMSREELVARFSLERVGASAATFDYDKLDWMNGVYLRELALGEYADRLVAYLREQGSDWPEERVREAAPLVQEKIGRLGEFPAFAGFLFQDVNPDPTLLDKPGARVSGGGARVSGAVRAGGDRGSAEGAVRAARAQAETGVRADPGGGDRLEGLARPLREPGAARPADGGGAAQERGGRSGLGRASGSSARWNSRQARRR